jgi:alkylated DNA repair protein alkB family protein 8
MIPGLGIVHDFITQERENEILTHIRRDASTASYTRPNDTARSLVLRYGWNYKPSNTWCGDVATWLLKLEYEIHELMHGACFDSFTVNEYRPGDKIAPHIDSTDFGPTIAILSLSSHVMMWFLRDGDIPTGVLLPARSMLLMTGDARYKWKHGIEHVEKLRYSIVFRRRL